MISKSSFTSKITAQDEVFHLPVNLNQFLAEYYCKTWHNKTSCVKSNKMN